MKPTAFLLTCFIAFAASAQNKTNSVSQSVHDDGKVLTLKINAIKDNTIIDYNQQFDVTGWSKLQKDAMVRRITDSLGVTKRRTVKI